MAINKFKNLFCTFNMFKVSIFSFEFLSFMKPFGKVVKEHDLESLLNMRAFYMLVCISTFVSPILIKCFRFPRNTDSDKKSIKRVLIFSI